MTGGELLVTTAVQLALLAMPMIGAMLVAVALGVRRQSTLLALAVASSGLGALLVFWAYYLAPALGAPAAYLLVAGGLAAAVWSWPLARRHPRLLRRLAVPLGLWALGTLFLVGFGFMHGGMDVALETGSRRFSTNPSQLPSDNFIPYFFADWIHAGHPGSPPIFEPHWMFSDRPPLQIGYLLSQRPFGWDLSTLHAQLVGVAVQQLWIIGLWAVLVAAELRRRAIGLILLAALVSDVVIVNGFFTWPKLLAAAFVLAALALVASPRGGSLHRQPALVVLLGLLVGLAVMAHGSSVFGLIALVAVAVWRRSQPSPRWLAAGLAVALVVVAPWTAYQHWGDPPGNRVVKWMLAGQTQIDDRGVLDAMRHAYSEEGLGGSLELKLQNFLTMAGGGPASSERPREWVHFSSAFVDTANAVEDLGDGHFGRAASEVRESRFSHLFWALGLLVLGLPVAIVARLRGGRASGPEWELARFAGFVFLAGTVVWGLVQFGNLPSRAIVTHASLALPLIAIAGIVAALWSLARRWAWWLVGANAATVLVLYVPTFDTHPGNGFSTFNALLAAASLVAFALLAIGWVPERTRRWWSSDEEPVWRRRSFRATSLLPPLEPMREPPDKR